MTTETIDETCPECEAVFHPSRPIGERYEVNKLNRFEMDADAAGLTLSHYHGRYWYKGPAVSGDDIQELMSFTTVKLQSDSLGRGVIVYPA